ncbi:uncharacterized protein N7511_005943 [Penicillium nucicola]|uniref:uncharacterized protein n=1 Tax=Penicillium nucicola TaxID=1850975 RepID=UPI002544E7C0|nr:uncharacterized protein N7511_005943 [Penicillium nucicola]KAJ5762561.1 hypothetical protein N7511_005943 [Penicillium nucicola]
MVNVFQRLTRRRAQSSGSYQAETTGPNSADSHPHGLQRVVSTSSGKRNRCFDEPSRRYLFIVSDTSEFDSHTIQRFQAEGFVVTYIPFTGRGDAEKDRKALEKVVHLEEDELETGERFAIIAYHRPAYLLLSSHHQITSNTNPFPRLCALIAYYPLPSSDQYTYRSKENCEQPACSNESTIFASDSKSTFLPIQIHMPGPRLQPCALWPWIQLSASEGDVTHKKRHRCHVYSYPGCTAGFAEKEMGTERFGEGDEDMDITYEDEVGSQLAWSRALGCLKRSFGIGSHWAVVDIETVWEEYWDRICAEVDERRLGDRRVVNPPVELLAASHAGDADYSEGISAVTCLPTSAGASDISSLRSFFSQTFIPNGPKDQKIRLLTRTVGSDRIVDEIQFSCRHTAEIPWLLPCIAPTGRDIQVIIIVVASFCAGQITRQSLYWDQASVLVQAGMLDPGLLPRAMQPVPV